MKKKEWFASWFDTSFYHTLYQHRNFEEAERFIQNLLKFLSPPEQTKILDLACGKGRHSYFIAKNGYEVTGVDLSKQSIQWAKDNYALDSLNFAVHDMRKTYKTGYFDYIFNFFTSFGYFEDNAEDAAVIQGMNDGLSKNGTLVIDFLNVHKAIANLKNEEVIERDSIKFRITRSLEDRFIVKRISFAENGEKYQFEERVKVLDFDHFKTLFAATTLEIKHVFGNYDLQEFNELDSPRLIIILRKNV